SVPGMCDPAVTWQAMLKVDLVAGGIGITPLKGMAEYCNRRIPIRLVYSSRSEDDHHVPWPQCREGALVPGVGEADSVSQLRRRPPARRIGMDHWFYRMQRLQVYESARCSR